MGLDYSQEAKYNRSLMVQQKIVFYVEDDRKEYEYEIIFEKLFGIKGTSFFVCSLGGKQNVYETYYKNLVRKSNKTFLYIVDGDFDIITKNFEISADNFLYLDRYNIENYFVWENAVICKKLSRLFYYFFYIHWLKLKETPITIGDGESQYFDSNTGEILENRINIKINELIKFIKKCNIDHNKKFKEFNNLYHDVFFSNCNCYICGKYILQGLCFYLINISKKNGYRMSVRYTNLKKYLIEHINNDNFAFILKKFAPYIK